MNVPESIVRISGWILIGFTIQFILVMADFYRNGERKAFRNALQFFSVVIILFGLFLLLELHLLILVTSVMLVLLAILVVFPVKRRSGDRIAVTESTSPVDERDTMFARASYRQGSPRYNEYYSRNPHLKSIDDRIRSLSPPGSSGGYYYHSVHSTAATHAFRSIGELPARLKADHSLSEILGNPGSSKKRALMAFCIKQGAADAGISGIKPAYRYAFKGRQPGEYGTVPDIFHKTAIIFTVEMDHGRMQNAPRAQVLRESAEKYLKAATISITLQKTLEAAGFSATSHHDAHYDYLLPPLAVEAGLGELGRINILMTPKQGPRVRLGAVSTDLELAPDKPVTFGGLEFCRICKKCATSCPSGSLSTESRVMVNGVKKWPTRQESCYQYWRKTGTDCGICMAVCPFSKPDTLSHNLMRFCINQSHIARYIALWMDNRFYGRRWKTGNKQ